MRRLLRGLVKGKQPDDAKQQPEEPRNGAETAVETSKYAKTVPPPSDAQQPAQQPKHVVFSGEVSRLSAPLLSPDIDVQSLVSHHGALTSAASGLACFPMRQSPSIAPTGTPVPSYPVRHPHLDRYDASATVRPGPSTPQRGDMPVFPSTGVGEESQSIAMAMFQQRSGTAMSHATTASNASSSFGNSSSHHGTGLYGANASYYPNLAILATYARDVSVMTGGNGIAQHLTWSEITDDDLVDNLGSRERTRQEVLFEMVCSEERYVQELIALKENYLDPILSRTRGGLSNSQSIRSMSTLPDPVETIRSTESFDARRPLHDMHASSRFARTGTPAPPTPTKPPRSPFMQSSAASSDHLPIAARFARRASVDSAADHGAFGNSSLYEGSPNMSSDSGEVFARGRRDISGGTTTSAGTATTAVTSVENGNVSDLSEGAQARTSTPGKNRFAARLQPLFTGSNTSKTNTVTSSMAPTATGSANVGSLDIPKAFRHHLKTLVPPPPNKLHKASTAHLRPEKELPLVIPEDLLLVCQTIGSELLEGHDSLSIRLRVRYEEQFPLVRSLAEVFTDQAWMVQHYATYVLHLEKALEQIEESLQLANPSLAQQARKLKDKDALKEEKRLTRFIMALEEEAAARGAPGLSICLSQPFQRLLKYPLLFQSLLYNSDPSLRDYDATQKLALEIDSIVRSIEDEKISDEQRMRTRDCWARIEGINDRTLMMPRAERLLVSEVAMWSTTSAGIAAARRTFSDAGRDLKSIEEVQAESKKEKHASRRLSDFVAGQAEKQKQKKQPNIGSKRDVWLITFTDVVIRCKRVGVTKLPMGLQHYSVKDDSKKYISLSRQQRNLYKFIKVDHWVMDDQTQRRTGVVSMEAVAKSRLSSKAEETEPSSESEVDDALGRERLRQPTLHSDVASRMSFSYGSGEPRPAFDVDPLVGLTRSPSPTPAKPAQKAGRNFSATTQEVVNRQGLANAKFGNRVRPARPGTASATARETSARTLTPSGTRAAEKGGSFNKPTATYLAKQAAMQQKRDGSSGSGLPGRRNVTSSLPLSEPKRARAASSNASSPRTSPKASPLPTPRLRRRSLSSTLPEPSKNPQQLRTKHSSEKLGNRRQASDMDSGVALLNQYWKEDSNQRKA